MKNYAAAVADFDKAIQLNPREASYYFERGRSNYSLPNAAAVAVKDYSKALELEPEWRIAFYNRGLANFVLEDWAASVKDFDKAITMDPTDPKAYEFRGRSLSNLERYDEAIADLTKTIELRPESSNAYYYRAIAYVESGQYEKGMIDYDKTLELAPTFNAIYKSKAWAYLYWNKGDLAYEQANTYLELNGLKNSGGDNAPYAIIIGYLGLRKANKVTGAKAFLETWLSQVKPDDWTTKILSYFNGELTSAQLLGLADTNGKLTEAHTYIGEMQLLAGQRANALMHFKWSKEKGEKTFTEYVLAVAELKRLAAVPATPTRRRPAGK